MYRKQVIYNELINYCENLLLNEHLIVDLGTSCKYLYIFNKRINSKADLFLRTIIDSLFNTLDFIEMIKCNPTNILSYMHMAIYLDSTTSKDRYIEFIEAVKVLSGDSIILNNEWLDNEWNIFLYLKELLFTNNSFQRETLSFYNLPFYTEENFKSIGNYLMIMQVNSMYNELAVYLYMCNRFSELMEVIIKNGCQLDESIQNEMVESIYNKNKKSPKLSNYIFLCLMGENMLD